MKIVINYDLLDKIQQAKTGFSLQRTVKPVVIKTGFALIISSLIAPFFTNSPEQMINHVYRTTCFYFSLQALTYGICDLILTKFTKNISKDTLNNLSILLKKININTNSELILDSYKYKTEYKINKDDNEKDLIQKKYIMIPIIENGEEKEISIVQEHVVGSKLYSISIGEPTKQKVFKLAMNSI